MKLDSDAMPALSGNTVDTACVNNGEFSSEAGTGPLSHLFERKWDYFVIKKDEVTGKLRSFIECCGRLSGIGS